MSGRAQLQSLAERLFSKLSAYHSAIAKQDDDVWKYFGRALVMLDGQVSGS